MNDKSIVLCGTLVLGAFFAMDATAQSCDRILDNGYRNLMVTSNSQAAQAAAYSSYCGQRQYHSNHSVAAQASVEIFGEGGGNGSYNQTDMESKLDAWCNQASSSSQLANTAYTRNDTISPEAVAAWQACIQMTQNGDFHFEPSFPSDADGVTRAFNVSMSWRGSTGDVILSGVDTDTDALACTYTTKDGPQGSVNGGFKPVHISTSNVSVHCARKVKDASIKGEATSRRLFPFSHVVIHTSEKDLSFSFAERVVPPYTESAAARIDRRLTQNPPIGTVLAYAGPGPVSIETGWRVCDGALLAKRDYPQLYAAIGDTWGKDDTGEHFRLPNLGGRFLRGSGLGISSGPTTPVAGNEATKVGTYQPDAFRSHDHPLNVPYRVITNSPVAQSELGSGLQGGPFFSDGGGAGLSRQTLAVIARGDEETRPVAAAINWIIRVDAGVTK